MSPRKNGRCSIMLYLLIAAVCVPIQTIFAQQKVIDSNMADDSALGADSLLNRRVSINVVGVTLSQAIDKAATNARVPVQYQAQVLETYHIPVTLRLNELPLRIVLERILVGTTLRVVPDGMKKLIVVEGKAQTESRLQSQETGTISGIVFDSTTKHGVGGATVTLLGSKILVVTKPDGSFRINGVGVGSQALAVKVLGYKSKNTTVTIEPNRNKAVIITLVQASTTLSEVVTTATGQQRRVEIPSDIVKIDPQKIMERAPVRNLTDLLEAAQVPGVLVQRANGEPGAPSRIRIRGIKTITGSKDPVVIVDGNFIDATVGTPSGIDDIDPATIESVEIVRGPSASTLYGQDAANGVIVITTKKGHAGQTRWRASYDRNWGQTYGQMPVAYQGFGYTPLDGRYVQCRIEKVIDGTCVQDSVAIYDPNNPLLGREGTETTNRIVLGVEGGNTMTTYSLTATSEQTIGVRRMRPIDQIRYRLVGLPVESKFQTPKTENRRTVNVGLTMQPRPNVTLGLTLTGAQTDLADNQMTAQRQSDKGASISAYSLDTLTSLGGVQLAESPSRRSNINLGSSLNWVALHGWTLMGNAGLSRSSTETSAFTRNVNCVVSACTDTTGYRSEGDAGTTEITSRMNVRKQLNFGGFSRLLDLRPSFGADFRKSERRSLSLSRNGIPPGERSVNGGNTPQVLHASSSIASAGYYASVTVGILQRLYFDLGTRRDIGSASARSGIGGLSYPKLGGSWLVSDESFWRASRLGSLFSTFRLRSALGYAAIQPQPGDIRGTYRSGTQYIGQQVVRSVEMTTVGNPSLKPERAMEVELGFDADVLGDWMSVVANYSHSETQNAIIARTLPPSAGVVPGSSNLRKENLGRVRNRDVEVTTQIRPLTMRTARLELSYTATLRENVVTKLGQITPFSQSDGGRIEEGYPVAGVWIRRVLGYRDADGDALLAPNEVVASDSSVYVGWSQPRYEAGYGITLTLLGGLTFDTRFSTKSRYVTKYTRQNKYGLEDIHAPLATQADELVASMNNNRSISDVRWNSASVTYYVPPRLLRAVKLRSLAVNLRGSNLGLWTNYVGRDPSVNSNLLDSEIASENGNEIPAPRLFNLSFTLGL